MKINKKDKWAIFSVIASTLSLLCFHLYVKIDEMRHVYPRKVSTIDLIRVDLIKPFSFYLAITGLCLAIYSFGKNKKVTDVMTFLLSVVAMITISISATTITQLVFIAAFVVFGPSYGCLAHRLLLKARPARWTAPAGDSGAYDAYINLAMIFCVMSAYAGWLVAGLQAMGKYPYYPQESPGEATALIYTLPGFITGLFGVGLSYLAGKRFNICMLFIMIITTLILMLFLCFLGFLGMFPHQE